jgi:type II secretory pathway predicted ATPase ExeA
MTKDDVLQKVNDYCTEKQYTTSTLTDAFKDKFADHFQKADPDGDINDDNVVERLKFALNTAFASASEVATVKMAEFESKENDYRSQIEELTKKAKRTTQKTQEIQLPDDVQQQLKELKQFKDEKTKQEKLVNILKIAKNSVRQDLHKSFDNFASDYDVQLDDDDEEQAKYLTKRFQEIFKDSIGDIKPLAPKQIQKNDEEFLSSIPKIKVQ